MLRSFGKTWGLAGLRLGFVLADPATAAIVRDAFGPWALSGPAIAIGTAALADRAWLVAHRARLARDEHDDAERRERRAERGEHRYSIDSHEIRSVVLRVDQDAVMSDKD